MKLSRIALALTVLTGSFNLGAAAEQRFLSIGTGGVTGVYYPAGSAICRLVNKDRQTHGIRCASESTGGSIDNINSLRVGELEFAVTQSDLQYKALHGLSEFKAEGPFDKERAVFAVHPEPFTLVVRKKSGIKGFEDLKGKKVNIGNPGSGQRATVEVVMKAFGMTMDDFALAAEYRGVEMAQQLCEGKIDAMIYTIGHPAAAIQEASTTCDVEVIPVAGAPIDKLIADNSYYRKAIIPGNMYQGTENDVATFGVGATIITSADVPDAVVYTVVKSVFDNFAEFKSLHPAFANLKESEMIRDGLSAPLHPGAIKYYRERGWLN